MMNFSSLIASPWAIKQEILPLISRELGRLARGEPMSDADRAIVADSQAHSAARRKQRLAGTGGGTVAVIPVSGVLTQHGGIGDGWLPTTSMSALATTVRELAGNPAVDALVLDLDSPGGSVYGVSELAQTIFDVRAAKPVVAVANSCAASAAYWVASQASEVYAAPGAEVGSIGVYTMHADVSEALKQDGVAVTLIAAGEHKTELSPYATLSADARSHVQQTVNTYHDAFMRTVARGRGVALKAVRDGMGRGRMLLPDDAKRERMIDGVATLDQVIAKLQSRITGRDKSAAGMRAYVAQQMRETVATPSSSPARALTREALEREIEVLKLT